MKLNYQSFRNPKDSEILDKSAQKIDEAFNVNDQINYRKLNDSTTTCESRPTRTRKMKILTARWPQLLKFLTFSLNSFMDLLHVNEYGSDR